MAIQMLSRNRDENFSQFRHFLANDAMRFRNDGSPTDVGQAHFASVRNTLQIHAANDWKAWNLLRLPNNVKNGLTVLGKGASNPFPRKRCMVVVHQNKAIVSWFLD
jgi:hypothetical protein